MTNAIFPHLKHLAGSGGLDLEDAITNGYLTVLLVLDTWVFDTYKDFDQLSELDLATKEFDGANYARQTLANASWDKDPTNGRSELTADPTVFAGLGPGTSAVGAALLAIETAVGTDATTVPAGMIDEGGFPFTPTGIDNTINWDAEGVLQIR